MEFVRLLLIFGHLLGMATLLAGFLTQMSARVRRMVPAMLHGALTQIVTGALLVGVDQATDHEVNNAKIGVKLAVAVAVLALVFVNRAREDVSDGLFFGVLALAVGNVAVAVFWT